MKPSNGGVELHRGEHKREMVSIYRSLALLIIILFSQVALLGVSDNFVFKKLSPCIDIY